MGGCWGTQRGGREQQPFNILDVAGWTDEDLEKAIQTDIGECQKFSGKLKQKEVDKIRRHFTDLRESQRRIAQVVTNVSSNWHPED